MKKRIQFKSHKRRKLFFEDLLKSCKIKNWKGLQEKFKINRNTLADYRKGKLTLPEKLYLKMSNNLNTKKKLEFNQDIKILEDNWGYIKGGKKAYLKNKVFFDKGRKKAIAIKRAKVHKFDIYLPLNKDLSYFIGLLIGDGFTNKYGRYYLTQFVGHLTNELNFYKDLISPLSAKLFGITPKIKEYPKINTLRANFYSKDLFLLITQRFKISAGRKSSFVLIPKEILKSKKDIILSCIAGIYEAEGSIYYDKRTPYKSDYPILELHMSNPKLINQISGILTKFNLPHYVRKSERIYFYGKKKIENFIKKVPIKNQKMLKKIKN